MPVCLTVGLKNVAHKREGVPLVEVSSMHGNLYYSLKCYSLTEVGPSGFLCCKMEPVKNAIVWIYLSCEMKPVEL